MVASSISLTWASTTISSNKLNVPHLSESLQQTQTALPANTNTTTVKCSRETATYEESHHKRRALLLGAGALTATLFPSSPLLAQEKPANYDAFVDKIDGYQYYYPSDWREFDLTGYDSAFKDRYLQLQNLRVSFIPTEKKDVHDLGPMEEVITDLVTKIIAAPNQYVDIADMQERSEDGKNYYTVEFTLSSRNFSASSFVTIAIANGRYYTLKVGANDRRWKRVRNKLKVVADSFKVLDI
uniref:PsbP-like protein 2 n=1 Tax=Monsonia marlothii TaxID=163685 RepID=A0A0F7CYK2_9ROSI